MVSRREIVFRAIAGVASGVLEGIVLILLPKMIIDAITYYAGEAALGMEAAPALSLLTSGYFIVFVALKTIARIFQETVLEPVTSTFTYLYVVIVLYSILGGGVIEETIELEAYTVWLRLDFSSILPAFLVFLAIIPALISVGEYVYGSGRR